MQLSKWGNSYAVRLPKDMVEALELKLGEELEARVQSDGSLRIGRKRTRQEALESLRQFRGMMPADFKFDREEANAR